MKKRLSIPIEAVHLLPYNREYSGTEAIVQIVFDAETQSSWTVEGYSKQFSWKSRTRVEAFLKRYNFFEKMKRHRKVTNRTSLKERKHSFGLSLKPYLANGEVEPGTYTKEQLNNFYTYWTAIDHKTGKMAFEAENKFFIANRLATSKRLIWDKGYSIDDNVSDKADKLIKFFKGYCAAETDPVKAHNKLVSMIKNSKKSEEIKKYALQKLGE